MIISKVGAIANKLKLPNNSYVHLVSHVSKLKRAIRTTTVQPTLPLQFEGDKIEWQLEEVLA